MSADLVDSVESVLQSRLGTGAGGALDVSTVATRTALRAIAPAIVAGLAEQGSTADEADDLLTILRGARSTDAAAPNLVALLKQRAPHTGAKAPMLLSQMLFNAQVGDVVDALSTVSDVPARAASNLLEVSIMAAFGMLRERAQNEGWNGATFTRALQLERMLIKVDLDRRIAKATRFDWLASDDPGASLLSDKKAASVRVAATPAAPSHPTGEREANPDDATSGRPRKSMMEMLQARMAQGGEARPAQSALGAAPRASVFAERRLDEYLEVGAPATIEKVAPPAEPVPRVVPDEATAPIELDSLEEPAMQAAPALPPAESLVPAPTFALASEPPLDETQGIVEADSRWPFSIEPVEHEHYRAAPASYAFAQEPWAIAPIEIAPIEMPAKDRSARAADPLPEPQASAITAHAAPMDEARDAATRSLPPEPPIAPHEAPALAPSADARATAPAADVATQVPGPLTVEADMRPAPNQRASKPISSIWLLPVVLAALVLGVFILNYRSTVERPAEPPPPTQASTGSAAIPGTSEAKPDGKSEVKPPAPDPVPDAKPKPPEPVLAKVTLPGGTTIEARENGFVASMVAHLAKANAPAGERFVMDEITFDRDTSMMTAASDSQLGHLAAIMEAYPRLRIRIEGHTDRDGDTSVVRALSADRAATIKAGLMLSGVRENRIQSQGFGADKPLSTSTSAQERAQNRRIEIVIVER